MPTHGNTQDTPTSSTVDFNLLSKNTYYGCPNSVFANKGWCSWGWFEDVVLNTYFGFMTNVPKVDDTGNSLEKQESMRTQIRSVSLDSQTKKTIPNTCRANTDHIFTIDSRVILPGKFFPIPTDEFLEEKLGVNEEVLAKYNDLRKFHEDIDTRFDSFIDPDTNEGIIRNFVFSADFLMKHFGTGITNLEVGLSSFWRSVSSIYGGFWNFEAKQSSTNSGRVAITETLNAKNSVGSNTVFPKIERRSTATEYKNVGLSEDYPDPNKTFEFSVYSLNSIISEFSVDVNIDSKMVTQAMYHSNKNILEVGNSGMNTPESLGILALSTLHTEHKLQSEIESEAKERDTSDKVLSGITTPYLQGKMSYSDEHGDLQLISSGNIAVQITSGINAAIEGANKLIQEKKFQSGMNWVDVTEMYKFLVYDFKGKMHKPLERGMLYYLNKSTDARKSVDPIAPLSISFTLQGIAGITIGNMFAVDYLPEVYRKFALFQVSKVGHEIGTEGWQTKIEAIMRIDMKSLETDSHYATKLKQSEEQSISIITEEEQGSFIDAYNAQLALAADTGGFWKKFFTTLPEEILAVSAEQAGKLLVELKEVEDELVLLHKSVGAYTIQQLIMIYEIDKDVKVDDFRKSPVLLGPIKVPKVLGSEILNHITSLYSKAKVLRHRIFIEPGYNWIKPQKFTMGPFYDYRSAFSKIMVVDESLKGLSKSGFNQQAVEGSFNKANRKFIKQYGKENWKVKWRFGRPEKY